MLFFTLIYIIYKNIYNAFWGGLCKTEERVKSKRKRMEERQSSLWIKNLISGIIIGRI